MEMKHGKMIAALHKSPPWVKDELPAVTKITCDICGKVIKDGDSTAAYYELTGHYYCIEDYAIHNEGPEYEPE